MEILTGRAAGQRARGGAYPRGTVNERVQRHLDELTARYRVIAGTQDGHGLTSGEWHP
jgi:hypothetical protein